MKLNENVRRCQGYSLQTCSARPQTPYYQTRYTTEKNGLRRHIPRSTRSCLQNPVNAMANNCSRIFLTTKRRPSYLLSTTGLCKPRSQVRPSSAHTTNSVQQMCKTSTKPTLPHLQPPRAIETHAANFQQTAGWGQTYPPHSVFDRSHPGCASQPCHSTYAGWFLPSISSHLVPCNDLLLLT